MDRTLQFNIIVAGLRLWGHHGVMNQERINGNEFIFDVTIQYDSTEGAVNDNLEGTLDYTEVIGIIKAVNTIPSELLENLAYRINVALRERWHNLGVIKIKISKPGPPVEADVSCVAVELTTYR